MKCRIAGAWQGNVSGAVKFNDPSAWHGNVSKGVRRRITSAWHIVLYSMFQLVCNIIRQHNSRSKRDYSILKKKPFIGNSLAFYTKQFSGIFYRSLIHFTPWGALDQIMQKRLFFSFFSTNYIHRQFSLSIFINYIRISYIWNLSGMKISKFCQKKSNIRKYHFSLKDIITYFAKQVIMSFGETNC